MRVLMLSKACIVGIYQGKLEAIASHPAISAFKVLVPPFWRDERGIVPLERVHTRGYDLQVTPMRLNGSFHLHYYPDFAREARAFQPDIVHIDEEPYNLATWLALRSSQKLRAKSLFFSWQNINRSYPLPIRLVEQWTLRTVDHAIMGTESAAEVWREKGYTRRYAVIPQFGVDPALFMPRDLTPATPLKIAYVGRLVPEKGIDLLLDALAALHQYKWQLTLIGGGPEEANLRQQAARLQIADRITFAGQIPSTAMPTAYQEIDILVIPSRTMPNWKEQFGRVIVEAMASQVVVIGSDSGAIPDVIGEAGLIFRENDAADLADKLTCLFTDHAKRQQLAIMGRQRVLDHFTQAQVAEKTVQVYQEMLNS